MKKSLLLLFIMAALASCGKKTSGITLAKKVCDCFENSKDREDDCTELLAEAEKKLVNDTKEAEEFSKAMKECTLRLIKLPK
jgi:hypothetical protein